ncbi:MAG: type IV pilus assembly protein PilM [Planctomycetes bacterium]|nr:type IV pilus assembly protein PilM [Planctomycetota bacterium]
MARRSLIGLDIGSRFIKAVELTESRDQLELTAMDIIELSNASQLRDALREILSRGGFHTKRTVTAVSGRAVIVRYINMPAMSDEELRNAVRYEAGKYIPFEVEDVILDCQRLEERVAAAAGVGSSGGGGSGVAGKGDEMRVLLVAVKRSFVDDHVAVLEETGLIPNIIDVDSFALGNAFELTTALRPGSQPSDRTIALVDVGSYKTNINILVGADSYFTREIYVAGSDFTEAIGKRLSIDASQAEAVKRNPGPRTEEVHEAVGSVLDDLCHEIYLSFDYFKTQFDREVDDIYLSGGGSLLMGLDETFQRTFGKNPVRWDPTEALVIRTDRVNPADLRSFAPQLAVAIGLAARIRKD